MALEERLKQRLLGGAVLVALVVIFVPMLIDEPMDSKVVSDHRIPLKPEALEKPMPAILPPPPEPPAVADKVTEPQTAPVETKQTVPTKPAPTVDAKPVGGDKPSPTAWMIQVASLTVKENAEKLVADLKKAEFPAMVEKVEVEGKRHYRVRVGPEVNHQTALSMAERIKRDFKLTPKVLRYPD
jgi:DedD protein